MLRIIRGGAGSGKTSLIFSEIKARAAACQKSILIVPETRSHSCERLLLEACGNRSAATAQVITFTKLAASVLASCGASIALLDGAGRALTMEMALGSVQSVLTHYTAASRRTELIDKLLTVVGELKSCCISPEALMQAAFLPEMPPKLHDIALIYSAYCGLCAQGALDPRDRLAIAAEHVKGVDIFNATAVYIDDFSGFTIQEYAFISAVFSKCESLSVSLLMGNDPLLFSGAEKTLRRLSRLDSAMETLELQRQSASFPPCISALERGIFNYSVPPWDAPTPAVHMYSLSGISAECDLVAGIIRSLVLQEGSDLRLRDIAVVCGDITQYALPLENAFARFDIPIFIAQKESILQKPPVLAAIGALFAICDGMSATSVFTWLKSGLAPIDRDMCDRLENYAYLWNIRGNKWFSDFTLPTAGYGNRRQDEAAALCAINQARANAVEPIARLKDALKGCKTCGDMLSALLAHWEDIGLEAALEQNIDLLSSRNLRRFAAEYAQLYDILQNATEQLGGVMGKTEMTLREFYDLLSLTVAQYEVAAIPTTLDSVRGGDFERLDLSRVKYLFIIGAREGLFPKDGSGGGLLGEHERIALEGEGIELTQSDEERAFEAQSRIYHALSVPTRGLFITYPNAVNGEACAPSAITRRISALLPQMTPESGDKALEALCLTAKTPAFECACQGVSGAKSPPAKAAAAYFENEKSEYFKALKSYCVAPRGPIKNPANIKALYGDRLSVTASRIEKLSSCRFSYFMQYGIRAKERRIASFGAPEFGTFVHYIVEHSIRDLCAVSGLDIDGVVRKYIDQYVAENIPDIAESSARFLAIFKRLCQSAVDIVRSAAQEIFAGDFRPLFFELDFGEHGDFPALELREKEAVLSVNGKIDRVDGFSKDGCLYLKIVDYKTGQKSFRLSDMLSGLNLQMFIYLLMLRGNINGVLNCPQASLLPKAQRLEPAGVLYIPAKNPYVSAELNDDALKLAQKRDGEVRRIGVVRSEQELIEALEHPSSDGALRFLPVKINKSGAFSADSSVADATQLEQLIDKTEGILRQLALCVARGDIEATPYRKAQQATACAWCEFKSACHFDETMHKDKYRFVPSMKNQEVFQILAEEEGAHHEH